MKYLYFYNRLNTDLENNYQFDRYTYKDEQIIASAYSDTLSNWNDMTTHRRVNNWIPEGWNLPYETDADFLSSPDTYTAISIKSFKSQYPELFI